MSLDDEQPESAERLLLRHPTEATKFRYLHRQEVSAIEPLLVDYLREGKLLADLPPIEVLRERRKNDVEKLDPGVRRLMNPHIYHVSLTEKLFRLKQELIEKALRQSH